MDHVPGVVYLLHLDRPYKHARHYLGWASDLEGRLAHHANGTGANLLRVAREAGISWTLARTWPGDRFRERQLKRQGGRARMCPICKQGKQATALVNTAASVNAKTAASPVIVQSQLPARPSAPRLARAAVRQALAGWGLSALAADAELITSELVANAAEHASGHPIGLTIRPPETGRGIVCEVSDTSPILPAQRVAVPDDERGRGLAIVTALATDSGVTARPGGKTAWFTLTVLDDRLPTRSVEAELEAEAGA